MRIRAGMGATAPPPRHQNEAIEACEGHNRGSWICPVHLDYFQLADICISLVFTWFEAQNLSNCNF